ncbi:MAG: hypothetical protein ACK4N5_02100, partial [Myxococcales bacterium]
TGTTQTINVLQWDPNALPRIFQRSDQLPLTDEEITRLSKAGFEPAQIVKMIEERRCACDASADGLIRLKEQGVDKTVISAISLHALKPNRALHLVLTLDVAGAAVPVSSGNTANLKPARTGFLYFFVEDGKLTRVYSVNLAELATRRFQHETMVDRGDVVMAQEVRRVQLAGEVPLTTYGAHRVLVVSSSNPAITHPSQLTDAERMRAQSFTFDYPRASIQNVCRLFAAWQRDPMLPHKWDYTGSRFECEWN